LAQWTYREALQALWQRSAYERGVVQNPFARGSEPDLGLRRTRRLLVEWGRPCAGFRSIHIAGSKGKGSTAAFAASALATGGVRTGLYSSPHLHTVRERIAVNGHPIDEAAFAALAQHAISLASGLERTDPALGELTDFELITAMALKHFAATGCAVAVVEVGLGGTFDATNVIDGDVSVITLLDYEHTAVLGTTLTAIAESKAGIIKTGRPVVSAAQGPEALRAIEERAKQRRAPLHLAGRDWSCSGTWRSFQVSGPWGNLSDLQSGLVGNHQVSNAGNAVAALWALGSGAFPVSASAIRSGIATARWPGRYEVIHRKSVRVVLDGAHSPASAGALARTIAEEEQGRHVVIVLGMLGDKDAASFAQELAPVATRLVVTASSHPRAMPPERLAALGPVSVPVTIVATVEASLMSAIEAVGHGGSVVVTGSFTTVAEARVSLGLGCPDPRLDQ
jgi:dihydrofolate synthase/folylpolyglutamate synthase